MSVAKCCICNLGTDDGVVLMTIRVQLNDRITACPDHLRQAISQSDVRPLTDVEWRQLASGLLESFAEDRGDEHGET